MGSLHWRKRGTRLGCRRGWLRIAGLAAFALAGYFSLYAYFRATGVIDLYHFKEQWAGRYSGTRKLVPERYIATMRDDPTISSEHLYLYVQNEELAKWPRSWTMKTMWPAVRLEFALYRCGWLPWSGVRKGSIGYTF